MFEKFYNDVMFDTNLDRINACLLLLAKIFLCLWWKLFHYAAMALPQIVSREYSHAFERNARRFCICFPTHFTTL